MRQMEWLGNTMEDDELKVNSILIVIFNLQKSLQNADAESVQDLLHDIVLGVA
ncbi:hypothetical protein DAPPUDRAFT_310346 [Daphnia pulex]|uniref:Uncharacterized protein n=1 Tax=Daphnia pulex TaxID=6669 RepID=E9FTB6_DAPPU|nr:hypothetical protein DAPPUDRAFT_310346 [Daphnia pulex]|eukprot:EFX89339.1 hypothetical protein DAPPUDRAFT_310346 [Daphnia pulex]